MGFNKKLILTLIFSVTIFRHSSTHNHGNEESEQNLKNGEPEHSYTGYQPSVLCTPKFARPQPKNIAEVQNLIRNAISQNLTVKAVSNHRGTRTDLICTQGLAFETPNFKRMRINHNEMTVQVGGGVKVKELFDYLHDQGYSLETTTTFGGLTIGGGLAVAAHGTTLTHAGCYSDLIVGIRVIDGKGNIRNVRDPEELKAFKCHLGLLGFVVDATLTIVKDFKVDMENKLLPESFLFDGSALMAARAADYYQVYWFPSTSEIVTSEGRFVSPDTPGTVQNTMYPVMSKNITFTLKKLFEKAQSSNNLGLLQRLTNYTKASLYKKVQGREPILSEDGETLKNPGVGWAKDVLTSVCGVNCRWDYGDMSLYDSWEEIAIDVENLDSALNRLKVIFTQYKAMFPWLGVCIRFAKKSDGYMSMTNGRDTAFLEITTPMRSDRFENARVHLEAIQSFVQCLVKDFDGRAHWAKNGLHYHSTKMIEKYEQLPKFKAAMNKFDPNGRFLNYFGLRLLGKSDLKNSHPKITHCALEQNCECSKNEDCSIGRECTTNSFGYKVCTSMFEI